MAGLFVFCGDAGSVWWGPCLSQMESPFLII
jgi:hypothetical protein